MEVAIVVFDGITVLDAIGPYEALRLLPDTEVKLVGLEPGIKRAAGGLGIVADHTLEAVPSPDIVVMPGGPGEASMRADERFLGWLRSAHTTTQWTTSVCTGSLSLAAAGLLAGAEATTHWMAMETLERLGAHPVAERVVVGDRVMTAAGVSAGIDMALTLIGVTAGDDAAQQVQLVMEYDPQPPYRAGNPATAPSHVVEAIRARRASR